MLAPAQRTVPPGEGMPNSPRLLAWKLTWLSDLFFTLLPPVIESFLCTVASLLPFIPRDCELVQVFWREVFVKLKFYLY